MLEILMGMTPLHHAAKEGHAEVIELLISKGAEVNARDNENKTPLKLAVSLGFYKAVETLKKHGGIR